jgi:penicillin-binding protein 1C
MNKRNILFFFIGLLVFIFAKTCFDFTSPFDDFRAVHSNTSIMQVTDRNGVLLSTTYQARWNHHDIVALHNIPEFLQAAFINSEDKRFFEHNGVDWYARVHAIWQTITNLKIHRGASSISEQVVRMLHPRPRTLWAKWLEGWEALALEYKVSKAEILEFYLNQVPYAANRRGILQAARYYFNRDLHTLHAKEMLSLAVLVRAPSRFDLYKNQIKIDESINRLALQLHKQGILEESSYAHFANLPLTLSANKSEPEALHFLNYIQRSEHAADSKINTTLDAQLQHTVQNLLQRRLQALSPRLVRHAAALVVDHRTNEVLAWVSLGANCKQTNFQAESCQIDMVSVPRQPGSALKPFLYAQALDQGWSPDTIIDDSPYTEAVGRGLHRFHNYSRTHYGDVTLRKALGNSLNIPAIHTINFVGVDNYLQLLHKLGFNSLTKPHYHYDEGLALGNGEVSLFEVVQGFSTLANRGIFRPLNLYQQQPHLSFAKSIF